VNVYEQEVEAGVIGLSAADADVAAANTAPMIAADAAIFVVIFFIRKVIVVKLFCITVAIQSHYVFCFYTLLTVCITAAFDTPA
jgi:hypothetical protein